MPEASAIERRKHEGERKWARANRLRPPSPLCVAGPGGVRPSPIGVGRQKPEALRLVVLYLLSRLLEPVAYEVGLAGNAVAVDRKQVVHVSVL
jgi:hypothetical protein